MKTPLSSTTWDDFHRPPAPNLNEPEAIKPMDIIKIKTKDDYLEILYYVEGQGKEIIDRFSFAQVADWAVKERYIVRQYELPVYDQENDEEYLVLYPPTSDYGTAEEINENRLRRFLSEMTPEIAEHLLTTINNP